MTEKNCSRCCNSSSWFNDQEIHDDELKVSVFIGVTETV